MAKTNQTGFTRNLMLRIAAPAKSNEKCHQVFPLIKVSKTFQNLAISVEEL